MLDSHPKAPRKSRRELWELLERPLTGDELAIPLNVSSDMLDKQKLKRMQEAVASVASELDVPEGLLCARKHLEALLEGRDWPPVLEGWRRERLEPVLAPLLPG